MNNILKETPLQMAVRPESYPKLTAEEETALFNEKSDFLLQYPNVKIDEIYFRDFISYVFERSVRTNREEEPFEEIGSKEYEVWLKQKKERVKEMDYTDYRLWRYNPIVFYQEWKAGVKHNKHRLLLKDDEETKSFCEFRQFAIMSPITYVGRNRYAKNARYLYAFAIDLDGVVLKRLKDLLYQMTGPLWPDTGLHFLPLANILVNSGHGMHVYYLLKEPIPLYQKNLQILRKFKYALTRLVWNEFTSTIFKRQMQGVHQGFRLPGTLTKFGAKIRAFHIEDSPYYTIEELNKYIRKEDQLTGEELAVLGADYPYNPSKVTLAEAARQWPEWYARKILEGNRLPKKWNIKRDLYEWWLRRISNPQEGIVPGHRYFCIMALALYAQKCDVPLCELKEDAFGLLDRMERLTNDDDNHFTEQDVIDALKAYNPHYNTFPRNSIKHLTGLSMPENRRNKVPQKVHLAMIRDFRNIRCKYKNMNWDDNNGRKKETIATSEYAKKIIKWSKDNPGRTKQECAEALGVHVNTVTRWWNTYGQYPPKKLAVMEWRKTHPEGTRLACAKDLGISYNTATKYWE